MLATGWLPNGPGAGGRDPVTREVAISAPAAAVWRALTHPAELAAWFGARVEIDVREGGGVRVRWPDGTERRGLVVTVDPPRRLAFRWRELPGRSGGSMADPSVVTFELRSDGDVTCVIVTESPGVLAAPPDAEGSP